MSPALLLASILALPPASPLLPPAQPVTVTSQELPAVDPSGGFAGTLRFGPPAVHDLGSGSCVSLPGAAPSAGPGSPLRPSVFLYVPVPPSAEPELTWSAGPLMPTGLTGTEARMPALEGTGLETREVTVEPLPDREEGMAVLREVVPLAGATVAVVEVMPVTDGGRSYATTVFVRLSWEPAAGGRPVSGSRLLSMVAPSGTLYWPAEERESESVFWGRPWARLAVPSTGPYALSFEDLAAAGCEVEGAGCASLRMLTGPGLMFPDDPEPSWTASEVDIEVVDSGSDGTFGSGDSIRFIARGLSRWEPRAGGPERVQHRYATHNVYWLTWGGGEGGRMGSLDATPDGSPDWGPDIGVWTWLREEAAWQPEYETSTGWVWDELEEGSSLTVEGGTGGASATGDIVAEVAMLGTGTHKVTLSVDGEDVLTDTWSGSGDRDLAVEGVTIPGSGTLSVSLVEESNPETMLGPVSFTLRHPMPLSRVGGMRLLPGLSGKGGYTFTVPDVPSGTRVYDVTDTTRPDLLTGVQWSGDGLVFSVEVLDSTGLMVVEPGDWARPDTIRPASPGRLLGTVESGDRLLVTHPSLLEGTWALSAVASSMGREPVVATTSEIYDELGFGVADPGAIRAAVRWAIDDWEPGLEGVLLVGDGHYDMMGRTYATPVMVPPWIMLGSREPSVDDNYVMAHPGSSLPEVPISRLPVEDASELGACTGKLLGYLDGSAGGGWTNRAMVVADDEWGQGGSVNETEHTLDCETIAEEVLPRSTSRTKFYMIEYPWPPGTTPDGPHPLKPEARADLIETISRGHATLLYLGHGAQTLIAHEKLMLASDVSSLTNDGRLSASFWGTCDVGRFDSPGADAIGEEMVLHPAGGSIVSVAATRGTFGHNNYSLFRGLLDSLYAMPDLTVADALWEAKLAQAGSYASNNRLYVLFGYGDMPLRLPGSDSLLSVEGDTMLSGEMNALSLSGLQEDGLAVVEILESSVRDVYTCLGGAELEWLRYGGVAFRGSQDAIGGGFELSCFVPYQSRVGELARASATILSGSSTLVSALDPTVLAQGSPSGGDVQGPDVSMWIAGYEGVEDPGVTGDVVLEAVLSDESGICFLGGSGRQLTLFTDGTGTDVGEHFLYERGSATTGRLTVPVEELVEGDHRFILWSFDGLGNGARDTLDFHTVSGSDLGLSEVLVYPNPGDGLRCFSFRVTEASTVSVSVYTIAGRRVEQISASCGQGYNQVLWDGLDRDGDPLATGSYIYSIEATASGSSVFDRTASETGVLVVVREGEVPL